MKACSIACVEISCLALQYVLKRRPSWSSLPVAIVDREGPQGRILEVNRHARAQGILPGDRTATALTSAPTLRADVIEEEEIAAAREEILILLERFSPAIEVLEEVRTIDGIVRHSGGPLWVDVRGLDRFWGDFAAWAEELHESLYEQGYHSAVVVGHTRIATFAIGRMMRSGTYVLAGQESEEKLMRKVPLDRLDLDRRCREKLWKLGVRDIGTLLSFRESELQERFGARLIRLHQMMTGQRSLPLQPLRSLAPLTCTLAFEPAENDRTRLLFAIRQKLVEVAKELEERDQQLAVLEFMIEDESGDEHPLCIRPAQPTRNELQISELIHLSLEKLEVGAGIRGLTMTAIGVYVPEKQLDLFASEPARSVEDAMHVIEKVCARYGPQAVQRVRVQPAHLPEDSFIFEDIASLGIPRPQPGSARLVRRIFHTPEPLLRFKPTTEGWYIAGLQAGTIASSVGPYEVAVDWWSEPTHRTYHYVKTERGDVHWIYWDHQRKQWFRHGIVE